MSPFAWIKKRFVPRGIYARAALILIVPVLAVQLVVSSVFIQRHYENVTEQMALALSLDLNLILDTYARDGEAAGMAVADALEIAVEPPRGLSDDRRLFYDLSGTVMTDIFYDRLPDVTGVDLRENWRRAVIGIGRGRGARRWTSWSRAGGSRRRTRTSFWSSWPPPAS
jgi:two-component system osmolarity sensor histidine kinase EnvZ